MKKITTLVELKEQIILLEIKEAESKLALKEQFEISFDNLMPINLIKNGFKQLTSAPDFKGNVVNSAIGLGAGFLSKKLVFGSTHNPIKQLLGTLFQVGITGIVSKNGDAIKLGAIKFISNLFAKKNSQSKEV